MGVVPTMLAMNRSVVSTVLARIRSLGPTLLAVNESSYCADNE